MKIPGKRIGFAFALAGVALFTSQAHASLLFAIDINGHKYCASDNNLGCSYGTSVIDLDPASGSLLVNSIINGGISVGFTLNTSTKGLQNILETSSLRISNNSGATATVTAAVSDTNYSAADNIRTSGSATFANATGITPSWLKLDWFNDPANGQGAITTGSQPGSLLDTATFNITTNPQSFSHDGGPFAVSDNGLYSMTEKFTLSLVNGGSVTSRGQTMIGSVPEPGALLLMGTALGMIGLIRRKKSSA